MEPRPGTDVLRGRLLDGRYRVGARIARGGMATVHEALDERLDRTVAVKIMHAGLSDSDSDREFADRFVREARAAARLSHPNVVAVHDQGDDDGTVFLVMELVAGHTLRDTIAKESPMPPARALALLEPVLSALAAAHRAGLVHRDVKPENVLIATEPHSGASRIKVADFGLAKAVSADTQHTATQGVLIGTVSYLAPELVIDGRADARADVYAAGVMLYELLTGVKPHEGETPIAVAYKHVHHDVPPPSERVPGLPAYVDALVARATARDRTQRPADAGVFLHQLHRVSSALADGVRDDPELTQDLAPRAVVSAVDTLDPLELHGRVDTVDAWQPATHWPEPTTTLPVVAPAPGATPASSSAPSSASSSAARPPVLPSRRPATPAPARPARPRRRRRGVLLLVLALLLALGLGGGAFWYGWARYSPAPTVLGQSRASAVHELEGAGLEVELADAVYDGDAAAGTVVAADPGGGARVLPGDTVTLTLSLGKLFVPKVRGSSEDEAQDAVQAVQLVVGESIGRYSESRPEGVVLGTVPKAGTELAPGKTVRLVVSLGREPIKVGRWVGKDVDAVRTALQRRGLEAEVVDEVYDDVAPAGQVLSQDPTSGTLFRGEPVRLVVSRGPELVPVPDVHFFGIDAARDALEGAGFEVATQDAQGSFGLGFVVSTDPEAGSMAPKGSTVTIFVA